MARTKHGSPEHFNQVIRAHVVGPFGSCRCGVTVPNYRDHIKSVWLPYELPEEFDS